MADYGLDRSAGGIVCIREDGAPGQREFVGRGTIDRIPIVLRIVPDGMQDGRPAVRVYAMDEVREVPKERALPRKLVDDPIPDMVPK